MKNFLIGIMLLPAVVGLVAIYHTLIDEKPDPYGGSLTNRVARAELVWLAMNKPKLFVDQFPQLTQDVEERHDLDNRRLLYSDAFDPEFFVERNPEIAREMLVDSELVGRHWLKHLELCRTSSPHFDVQTYLKRYPDLFSTYEGNCRLATNHWVKWGKREGRIGTPEAGQSGIEAEAEIHKAKVRRDEPRV